MFVSIAPTNSLLVQVFDSSVITLICILLEEQANGAATRFLPRTCGLLRDSCGNPKLSGRDADDPLEVEGKVALVQKAYAEARHQSRPAAERGLI